ncbi:MAG: zinc-ribbon domain-containing protein [Evtepia gabavorous]
MAPHQKWGADPGGGGPRQPAAVWWQCPQGHTWQAAVFSRSQGADCPCARAGRCCRGNDLATVFPSWPGNGTRRGTGP